jgi:diadenosine tetraphosphate (Ap4A) HIT family hydrolase
MTKNCDSCKHLGNSSSNILTTDHWVVALAPDQGYLGRCYVTLREHKGSLSLLSEREWADFASITRQLEGACEKAFSAAPFNWSCLMNNAFQVKPASPHVHWHFRPRYEHPVQLNGTTFVDPQFGFHYDREQRRKLDDETYQIILEKITANLS